jgi:vancomycin resistance protein YoaR
MLLAVAAVLLSSTAADAVASAGRIRSGVRVGGLELGGRTFEQAERALTSRAKLLAARDALFTATGSTVSLAPETVQYFPDVDATLASARRVGRGGNIVVRIWQRLRTYFTSSDIGWRSDLDRKAARKSVDDWAKTFDNPGHEAGIKADAGRIVPVAPLAGRRLDRARAIRIVVRGFETWPRRPVALPFTTRGRRTDMRDAENAADRANRLVRAPITLTSPAGSIELQPEELARMLEAVPRRNALIVQFSPELVKQHLAERMKPFERASRDASFDISGTSVAVRPSEDGLKFDATKTAEALGDIADRDAPRTTDAAFTTVTPTLTTDEAKALRIREMVSTFTTRHPAGQPRVKNIHIIADTVNNTIVKPGEVFSLNRRAGERTADRGYVMAPMIFDGEFKDQVGGGVSQFATTMFNAVFFGGYEFVSYKPHSYYISRYPAGRDATVSWPAPDFKFRNNSGAGILIRTSYSGSSITVTFYGDKEGKRVDVESEPRTNIKPIPEKVVKAADYKKQDGAEGFDIVVWRIITRDGKTRRQKFFTRYLAEPRLVLEGTPSPSPSTAPGSSPEPGATSGPTAPPPSTPPPATPTPKPNP